MATSESLLQQSSYGETSKRAHAARTDSTIGQLKLNLANLQQKYADLRRTVDADWRRRETEIRQKYLSKLEAVRDKCQREKQRELESLVSAMKRDYEQRLTTALQIKDKEIRRIAQSCQTKKHQAQSDTHEPVRNSDVHLHQKMFAEMGELREKLSTMNEQLISAEKTIREKDEEIQSIKQTKTLANQHLVVESQRHIRSLLDEIRQKERQINKLEHSLKNVEHQLVRATSSTLCTAVDSDMSLVKSAPLNPARLGAAQPIGMSRDEYEREKQRWIVKQAELESQLKSSEQANAELAQTKADLIRRNRDLEKTQKFMQDNLKKLTDKHKASSQDAKEVEEKYKQCQEENINLKQNLEKSTLECNRLKDKRAKYDKNEEVDKLRQQALDYCKTISALKQMNIEKDRRLDLLHQKCKRIKRCRNKTVDFGFDEDTKSSFGSDHSVSSASLNTITEDWAELSREELETNYRQLARSYLELQRVYLSLSRCHVEFSSNIDDSVGGKYQEALKRIDELEKRRSTTDALGADADWAQEKMKYASLTKSLQNKVEELQAARDKVQFELQEAKEQNELLEFQLLENQQADHSVSSTCSISSKCSSVCDRSVSTSEDEGVYSMESDDNSEASRDYPLDDLKMRFTLLKHRKELRGDDKKVIAQVKEVWETLYNQHIQCNSKEFEWGMKLKENQVEIETLKKQLEDLSTKKRKRLKAKELQKDLDEARKSNVELIKKNKELDEQLRAAKMELDKVNYVLKGTQKEEQRQQQIVDELRKRVDSLMQGRRAEMEMLESASSCQTKELETFRRKDNDLESEIKRLTEINQNLALELEAKTSSDRLVDEKKFCETALDDLRRTEANLRQQLINEQELYRNVEQKFQESLKTIRDFEANEAKNVEELNNLLSLNETLTKTVDELHRKQISLVTRNAEQDRCAATLKQALQGKSEQLGHKETTLLKLQKEIAELRQSNVKEVEMLKIHCRDQTSALVEEKARLERNAAAEVAKLYKQLSQLKSYSCQLEAQFEIQLQTVQILKNQLINAQTKTQIVLPSQQEASTNDHSLLGRLRTILEQMPQNFGSESNQVCCRFEAFCAESDDEDLRTVCQYLCQMLKIIEELKGRIEEFRAESDIARREADKANVRADKLCKQYRETILQISDIKREFCSTTDVCECSNSASDDCCRNFALNQNEPKNEELVEKFMENVKYLWKQEQIDIKILRCLQSKLHSLIKREERRTHSPLEFSGTESEICGDKSPTLDRYQLISSSSNSERMSPAHHADHHSSFDDDCMSDSWLSRTADSLRRTRSACFEKYSMSAH